MNQIISMTFIFGLDRAAIIILQKNVFITLIPSYCTQWRSFTGLPSLFFSNFTTDGIDIDSML